MDDVHGLQRFIDAQAPVWGRVQAELAAGAKTSHWMWFVFPQLRGLGRSATAVRFGIASLAEAVAYWQHPLLGARLKACSERVLQIDGKSALQIFGSPDDLKLRSCMTLFERAAPGEAVFGSVLKKYFSDARDAQTLKLP